MGSKRSGTRHRTGRAGWLPLLLLAALTGDARGAEPPAGTPRLTPVTATDPLIAHTLYTWYTEQSFANASVRPLEIFRSDDPEYYRRYFSQLRANGVDVIAGVLTGLPDERGTDGKPLPTSYQARNLVRILPIIGSAGMKFFIYYDLGIRSFWKCGLDRGELDLRKPELRRQLLGDFEWIADKVVKEQEDGYLFLQTASGEPVLDEDGFQRPVIAIYIARAFKDDPGFPNVRQILDREITGMFHRKGLGRPALILDTIFWGRRAFDSSLVAAFGANAAALTAFCPVTKRDDVHKLADWVPLFDRLYASAAAELSDSVSRGELDATLQIWPGIMPNFETRTDKSSRISGLQDWEAMLRMGLKATRSLASVGKDDPIRAMTVVYSDEYYEGTPLITDNGLFTLPLTVQGSVLVDSGIWLDRF